jgi:hypothetical protein
MPGRDGLAGGKLGPPIRHEFRRGAPSQPRSPVTISSSEASPVTTQFTDAAQMETMFDLGMQEGMTQAIGQIDSLLAPASV